MLALVIRRRLEAGDAASLRVDAAKHLSGGSVLPRRVASLEHDEHGVACVGVQHALQIADAVDEFLRRALEVFFAPVQTANTRVVVVDSDRSLRCDRLELHVDSGLRNCSHTTIARTGRWIGAEPLTCVTWDGGATRSRRRRC